MKLIFKYWLFWLLLFWFVGGTLFLNATTDRWFPSQGAHTKPELPDYVILPLLLFVVLPLFPIHWLLQTIAAWFGILPAQAPLFFPLFSAFLGALLYSFLIRDVVRVNKHDTTNVA